MVQRQDTRISRRGLLRLLGMLSASSAAATLLNGCGTGRQTAPTTAPTRAPSQSTSVPEPTAVPPAAQGGTVKWAEFYSLVTDANGKINQDWIAGIVKQFEEENPGWKVELEAVKWDQIDQKSILDLSAGVDHDLMFSSPQLMAKHAKTGDYLDLTEFIKTMPQSEIDDLSWSPGWKSATVAGQQIGVATGVHTRGNAYRRDWFEEAGLDPDRPFTTLEEVVDAAQKLTRADEDRWGLGLYMGPSRGTVELYYGPIVWAFGGDYFDVDAKKATLTGEASIKAVQWLYDCVYTYNITPPYAFAPDADYGALILDNFLKGKVAQAQGFGSYWIGAIEQGGMLEGCFPATKDCKPGTAGFMVQPGAAGAQFTNAWCLSIHKLSKNPEMAFKLLLLILRPENLASYPDAGLPARLSAWQAPEYSSRFYQDWLKAAKQGRGVPPTPYYAELADTVAAALQEILSKKADIAATMKKFEDEWNAKYAGE